MSAFWDQLLKSHTVALALRVLVPGILCGTGVQAMSSYLVVIPRHVTVTAGGEAYDMPSGNVKSQYQWFTGPSVYHTSAIERTGMYNNSSFDTATYVIHRPSLGGQTN